jgi:lactoylglutathione lyase
MSGLRDVRRQALLREMGMKIEHVALWTKDLENLKTFYSEFFGATANQKYTNPKTGFESYFLIFTTGARLEIMRLPAITGEPRVEEQRTVGLSHIAFAVGSREQVQSLTERLRARGYHVVSEPRQTGDGYYESCILDPDGNRVEITV